VGAEGNDELTISNEQLGVRSKEVRGKKEEVKR
jgi:hypothetical protein